MWISVDMEGIGGVATHSHVMTQGVEYARARRWMADEANACIEGAANGGAKAMLAMVRIAPSAVPPEQS